MNIATSNESIGSSDATVATSKKNIATSNESIGSSEKSIATSNESIASSDDNVATSENNIGSSKNNLESSGRNLETIERNLESSDDNLETCKRNLETSNKVKKRISRQNLENLIINECENYISLEELSVKIKRDYFYLINEIIPKMVRDNKLQRLYPDTPNHPKQKYKAKW